MKATREQLDEILVNLCGLLLAAKEVDSDYYGCVAACILDPNGQEVSRVNFFDDATDTRIHAERAAIDAYLNDYGDIPAGSICITTLSPCNRPMGERYGESCEQLLKDHGIKMVYAGYKDPTQDIDPSVATKNSKLEELCKKFADTFLNENFADGKKPGRKGLAKRSGVNCKQSVTKLRSIAANSSGEKQRMAHWCANMKSGRKK